MKTTLIIAMVLALFATTLALPDQADARARYGSHRVGGYTSHGKGSHYIGGYVRSCHGSACN